MYYNSFIILFIQIIHKNKSIFKLTVQYLEIYSSTSYITTVFMLASDILKLEIKMLYSIQYCIVKCIIAKPLVEDTDT